MSNRIINSYKIKKHESLIISRNFKTYKDWDKDAFRPLKLAIITHLRIEQKNKCCYCKRELGFDLKQVEIEHIVPKSAYEIFTFLPKNLALSCPGCNTSKNAGQILYKPIVNYPRTGANFKIVHAHFDEYDRHIAIHAGSIYEGLDEKGINTIGACKIFRLRNVLERQRESDIANGSPIFKLVNALQQANPEQRQDIEEVLGNILK